MRIKKIKYKLDSNLDNDIKIAVLADVHYYSKRNSRKLNRVLKSIQSIKADYICIPGDLMDCYDVKDEDVIIEWFKELSKISKIIISIGNHEFIHHHNTYNKELFNKIDSIDNCYVVDNKLITIDNIDFLGITIPDEYYSMNNKNKDQYVIDLVNKNIQRFKKHKYSIMLCHSPIDMYKESIFSKLNIKENIDLVICGHMHGGITPNIFKKFMKGKGFYAPNGKIFSDMCYGLYDHLGAKCIISSGVTKSSHTNKFEYLDFLFAPEITIVEIKSKSV